MLPINTYTFYGTYLVHIMLMLHSYAVQKWRIQDLALLLRAIGQFSCLRGYPLRGFAA